MFRRSPPFGSLCRKKSVVYPLTGRYEAVHWLRDGSASAKYRFPLRALVPPEVRLRSPGALLPYLAAQLERLGVKLNLTSLPGAA